MLLLISDANILIDIEIGGLIAPMFRLEYQFAVPDILFYEELDGQHAHLLDMGLQPKELDEAMVARVSEFATKYPLQAAMIYLLWFWQQASNALCLQKTRI